MLAATTALGTCFFPVRYAWYRSSYTHSNSDQHSSFRISLPHATTPLPTDPMISVNKLTSGLK